MITFNHYSSNFASSLDIDGERASELSNNIKATLALVAAGVLLSKSQIIEHLTKHAEAPNELVYMVYGCVATMTIVENESAKKMGLN